MIGVANLLDLFRRISFKKLIVTEEFVRTEAPRAQRIALAPGERKQLEVRVPRNGPPCALSCNHNKLYISIAPAPHAN